MEALKKEPIDAAPLQVCLLGQERQRAPREEQMEDTQHRYFSKITSYHDIVLELDTVVVVYNFVDILKTTFPW